MGDEIYVDTFTELRYNGVLMPQSKSPEKPAEMSMGIRPSPRSNDPAEDKNGQKYQMPFRSMNF